MAVLAPAPAPPPPAVSSISDAVAILAPAPAPPPSAVSSTSDAVAILTPAPASPPLAVPTAATPAALPTDEIPVAIRPGEPFVIEQDQEISGFSIDLWHAIATELGLRSRFVMYRTVPDQLGSVAKGEATLAISTISITSEREKTFEFSQPMFRSGLAIMVPNGGGELDLLGQFLTLDMLKGVGIFFLILIIPTHLIWLLARGTDQGLPISRSYFPGIFEAVFWCMESMGGAAQEFPRRIVARIVAVVWIYAGLVFVTIFTAYATTSLTMQVMKGNINGPNDLAGKRVAVVLGSTSARYSEKLQARMVNFPNFKAAAEAMLAGQADAVVYDAPMILYYTKNHANARIAGATFHSENYGILFPPNSQLRRRVNAALLKLSETGAYESLYKKWFGD